MSKISFSKKNKAPFDANPEQNLMQNVLEHGLPVASSCNGDGVCAKCKMTINNGLQNLTPETEVETFLKSKFKLAKNVRISCQTFVKGDVEVDTTYW